MANIHTISANLTGYPARLAARFRASMESPELVGQGSTAVRFAKIQWAVILWRCMTLAEVAIMAAACPSCFFPLENALLILTLGIIHVLVFSWLWVKTSLTRTVPFYIIDFAVCMALMIMARDGTLVIVVSLYATTALFMRPILRFDQAIALPALTSAAFLIAMYVASPIDYSTATIADYSSIFFFFGVAWALMCQLIERASVLEIDMHLEEQRRSFRRRLHDDLGNTLCGLHFKIQSLFRIDRHDLGGALALLEDGYGRASKVLDRILTGIRDADECDFIEEMVLTAENDFGIGVRLTGNTEIVCLNPAVRQEVFSLLREAIANSAKHSGTNEVSVNLSRCRRQMEITVSDKGSGFKTPILAGKQHDDGLGLKNMGERAEAIGARLVIESSPGTGTTVSLSLKETDMSDMSSGRLVDRLIKSDTYLQLVRLKLATVSLVVLQLVLGGSALWTNPTALIVTSLTAAEAIACYRFRDRLLAFLTRRPWWLILDILFFCLLYFTTWEAEIPVLVAEATTFTIVFSAWFLGTWRNLVLALMLGAGMIFASLMAPPEVSMSLVRTQDLYINVIETIIFALLAGLSIDFVRNINSLRNGVVEIALEQHRVNLSTETHKGLYQLVENLRREIRAPGNLDVHGISEEHLVSYIKSLETRSTHLKSRLRSILNSIDLPVSETGAVEIADRGQNE